MSMNSITTKDIMQPVNAGILLTVAPDDEGDNYYANEARLFGDEGSYPLCSGSDWKNAVYTAAMVARKLGSNVVHIDLPTGRKSYAPHVLENAAGSGREEFFAALGVTVGA